MTPTVQAIAWTLIHFCWQAAAIAAVYRALSLLAARRSSNARYLLALGALLLMVTASAATFGFEMRAGAFSIAVPGTVNALETDTIAPFTTPASGATQSPAPAADAAPARAAFNPSIIRIPVLPISVLRFIDGLWLFGVLTLSLRSLGGWMLIRRLRASATVEASAAALASFRRISAALGLRRRVLLRVSSAIAGPVTVGALRALVLLPLSAATSLGPDELEVVLAHELAHVLRADFFWNLVQIVAETLFFFHPAVWWLGSRIRQERELCCDDLALTVCPNPVVYANALFQLEQQRSRQLNLAMALDGHQPARTLRMRIARILGEPQSTPANRGPFSLAAAAAVLVVLLLPVPQVLASLNPAPRPVPAARIAPAPDPTPQTVVAQPSSSTSRVAVLNNPSSDASPTAYPIPAQAPPEPAQTDAESKPSKGDYIDRMKAAGYDVDLDKYVAMKIQDVTPEYARAMSQLGFGKLSADDLIACKIQGVTPEYIAELKKNGLDVKDVHDAISYRIFAVTPEFVAGMKTAGVSDLTSKQLLAMRVQGVTPEYAQSIVRQFPGATAEDLVKTRIFNIDANFIASAKRHGFTDLTLERLVKLRISGILDDEDSK
ncbi:MAG: M56 family metallopeptidase [Terracidiphilus sp.]|jgi:beta-lactamase regulating signal transducer with metallopeptidase domain